MPPATTSTSRPMKPGMKAGAEFMVRPKYKSTIPPLPFDPKSLRYPFPEDMLVQYHLTSLERTCQYGLPMPDIAMDLMTLGVLDAENFDAVPIRARRAHYVVDPKDEPLLVDIDSLGESSSSAMAKVRPVDVASAVRRVETSSSSKLSNRSTSVPTPSEISDHKVLTLADASKESQIAVIESTFDACSAQCQQLKHPTKPQLTAVGVAPLIPDLTLWPHVYSHLSVDDPLPSVASQETTLTQFLRPRRDDSDPNAHTVFTLYQHEPSEASPEEGSGDPSHVYAPIRSYQFDSKGIPSYSKLALRMRSNPNAPTTYLTIRTKIHLSKPSVGVSQGIYGASRVALSAAPLTEAKRQEALDSLTSLGIDPSLAHRYLNSSVDQDLTQISIVGE